MVVTQLTSLHKSGTHKSGTDLFIPSYRWLPRLSMLDAAPKNVFNLVNKTPTPRQLSTLHGCPDQPPLAFRYRRRQKHPVIQRLFAMAFRKTSRN